MDAVPWIDTHCHLDASEFDADRDEVVARARALGVGTMVLPAVGVASFAAVRRCAGLFGCAYTLGIHPLCVGEARETDLATLEAELRASLLDPRLVGVGEIGLDAWEGAPPADLQGHFFEAQLGLATRLGLPVVLHVRRAVDPVLRQLRRMGVAGGIAHAFNGSPEQAEAFTRLGLRLGFGGACTYDGSLRIRRLAASLPEEAIVLETDAPDIPPQWRRAPGARLRNEPGDLPAIAQVVASLRQCSLASLARTAHANSLAALPRLAALQAGAQASRVPGPCSPP
jgi:TatD DNase family protein